MVTLTATEVKLQSWCIWVIMCITRSVLTRETRRTKTSKTPFRRWTSRSEQMCLNVCTVTHALVRISPILCKAQATLCVLVGAFLRDCEIVYTDFTRLRGRRCVQPNMCTPPKRNNCLLENGCFCWVRYHRSEKLWVRSSSVIILACTVINEW